ncbi:uncharacterized protein LODBEIA_P13280 [Lodderomyces beijingensis]|uniref:Uncharacterized protein n=1 Tax=Lodderomyces beijingensis TaxID=1775926 RepID=A0ABP0ZFZ3_9ASCO
MFKTSFTSFAFPQWFKKPEQQQQQVDPKTIPKSFNIQKDNKLVNVSMSPLSSKVKGGAAGEQGELDEEDFIEISMKSLTYAEAAALGKPKKPTVIAKPSKGIVEENQFTVLDDASDKLDKLEPATAAAAAVAGVKSAIVGGDDDLVAVVAPVDDSVEYEPFKSDDEYTRSQHYKKQQHGNNQKRRKSKSLNKAKN